MVKRQKTNDNTIKKFNELYISTRKKYIKQKGGQYSTFNKYEHSSALTLSDWMLELHLNGSETYGVFNANTVNKFITFDVDYANDQPMARWATLKLIDVLESEFNIRSKDIHVSFSGSKGYHVDLFFDEPIKADDAVAFYQRVIATADLPSNNIEFRPTYKQAVKLPLGIHQKTGARCWFVDRDTLEPIESLDYLDDVEPMDHSLILDALIDLTPEQEAEFKQIKERTDVNVTVVSESQAFEKVTEILTAGQLLRSNTRHETTVLLATFCNSQGYEQEDAIGIIMETLWNTPREYFSKNSTPEFWQSEAERIVKYAYERNYQLGNADRPITIYRSEMLAVLNVGTFRQKQVAYAMLVTSKRYGSTFYLTLATAMKMTGASKPTVSNAIKKLVEVGFIEYVRKREVDIGRSRDLGRPLYKPNQYRILIEKPKSDEKSIEVLPADNLVDVAYLLCDSSDIKGAVGRREYDNRWSR